MKIFQVILVLFSLLFCVQLQAQILPIEYDTLKRNNHEIVLEGGVDFYATAVQRDIFSKFIQGGLITSEMKDNSFNRHKGVNRLGALAGGEIEYHNFSKKLFKKKDWGYVIKGGYHFFAGMIYSQDLFGLAFYGNERYMGETIDFSGTNVSYMAFQKVGFGMIDNKTKSSVSLNVYNISDRFTANFRTAELFQDAAGDNLSLEMDGEVELRNSNNFSQGVGLGLDLDFKVPVAWGKEGRKAFLRFQAQNVGVAYLYEKQKVYSFDTTFEFNGLTFEQVIGDNSILSDSLNILDTLGISSNDRNRTVMLPGFIQIGKIVDEHYDGQLQSFFGLRLYPSLIYSPYVFAGLDYHPADWVRIGVNAAYGGFGGFRAGLYSSFSFNNYSLGLGSENILGFFTKKSSGQSLLIRLRCAF